MPMLRLRQVFAAAVAALFVSMPALAGPPLLCFPFDIGGAKSLSVGAGGWHAIDARYDATRLVDDTLALLTPSTPIVVRMETLRRATLYAAKDADRAKTLLDRLQQRATIAGANSALAVFDFGYLVETYKQGAYAFKPPIATPKDIDGYSLVEKAAALSGDPRMEFALAVMTRDRTRGAATYQTHLERTLEAARSDPSIQANLVKQFGEDVTAR